MSTKHTPDTGMRHNGNRTSPCEPGDQILKAVPAQAVIELAPDAIVVADVNGRILLANRQTEILFDVARPALLGQPVEQLLPERFHAVHRQHRAYYTEEPRTRPMGAELKIFGRRRDGSEFPVEVNLSPLYVDQMLLIIGVIRDTSQRERLRGEREAARVGAIAARRVNAQLSRFLGIASHDLRQPVTSCSGYLQLANRRFQRLASSVAPAIGERAVELQAIEDNLARASQSAERLGRLVNRLFDVTQIWTGQFELHRELMDLAAIVRETVEAQRVAEPGRSIRLDPQSADHITVLADADRIGQVLTNYLTNALRYAPADRPIDVKVGVKGHNAHVAVRDQGPGMAPDQVTDVWARFERLHTEKPPEGAVPGLGLGLYISKEIIEHHEGQVGVETAPEQGSTFWFTLPLADQPKVDEGGEPDAQPDA
jgi:PAS domain S-box-containing protein